MQVIPDNFQSYSGSLTSSLPQKHDQQSPEELIVNLVQCNREYVECYLLFLFHKQEDDEKARHKTIHRNGVGFNAVDASIFTSMAERLLSGHSLSSDELAACCEPMKNGKPRLAKYWRQLLKAQNERLQ